MRVYQPTNNATLKAAPALRSLGVLCMVALTLTSVGGCSGVNVKQADPNPTYDMPKGPGIFSGKSGNILDAFKNKNGGGLLGGGSSEMAVNAYLWRASLESVGFMPLTQADSNGGTIITDWYVSPQNPTEKVKVNILILGKELRADAIQAKVFKQTKDSKGVWNDAPADAATARQLEDIILTKARAMKVSALKE
ncbi:MAG: DUF3576 domain-containing protein [Alphaproteobacteria bacterium]